MEAKIIAVADVVEAMASHRPYRPALGMNQAIKEITGRSMKVVREYIKLYHDLNPEASENSQSKKKKTRRQMS